MSRSHRYPALALGLALGLHVLFFLAVFFFAPGPDAAARGTTRAPSMQFSIGLVSLSPSPAPSPPAKRGPRPPEWVHEEFEPVVSVGSRGPAVPVSIAQATPGGSVGGKGASGGGGDGAKSGTPGLLAGPESARRIVYALDRSISMGHTGALARAKREILFAIHSLPPEARFHVLAYNNAAAQLTAGDWNCPTPEAIRAVEAAFDDLFAGGPTHHVNGLKKALLLRPDLVFLLTDADDLKPEDVGTVGRANLSAATIHVVELTTSKSEGAETPLSALARANGGSHRRIAP